MCVRKQNLIVDTFIKTVDELFSPIAWSLIPKSANLFNLEAKHSHLSSICIKMNFELLFNSIMNKIVALKILNYLREKKNHN